MEEWGKDWGGHGGGDVGCQAKKTRVDTVTYDFVLFVKYFKEAMEETK